MKSLLLISLFLLVSCGQKKYMPVRQDPVLKEEAYKSNFAKYAPSYGVNDKISKISLRFGDLGYNGVSGVIGQCVIYQKSHFNGIKNEVYEYGREIVIDPNFFNSSSQEDKDQLMTHELGHCSINRNHQDGYFEKLDSNNYVGVSVMNSLHGNVFSYNQNIVYYMEELFTRRIDLTKDNVFKTYTAVYGMTDIGTRASTYHNEEIEIYEHGHEHVDGDEHELEEGHVKIVMLGENDEIE